MKRARALSRKRRLKLRTKSQRQRRLGIEALEDRRVLATFIWDGNSDGDGDGISWNNPLNWSADAGFPNSTADTATFADQDVGQVDINGAFTVGGLALNNTVAGVGYNLLAQGPAKSLTIDDGAGGVAGSNFNQHTKHI